MNKKKKTTKLQVTPAVQQDHVSISLQEFHAFQAREGAFAHATEANIKLEMERKILSDTVSNQLQLLTVKDLKVLHLERVALLQDALLEHFKDTTKVMEMAEMSEFWKQWQIQTKKATDSGTPVEAIAKITPNIFKTWEIWLRDAGKVDRSMTTSGSRAERDNTKPQTQGEMQAHTIRRLREDNFNLERRAEQLHTELEAIKEQLLANAKSDDAKT
jgi:hypothetical protein